MLNFWRGMWDQEVHPTAVITKFGTARFNANGKRLMLPGLVDVSGHQSARTQWEKPATEAEAIIYLVNAKALYLQEQARPEEYTPGWVRIEDDAGQIGSWLKEGNARLCIVAVTHRDKDPRHETLAPDQYDERIEEQLEVIVAKLGGEGRVRVVIGSLDTRENAELLTVRIVEQLSILELLR